jgi:hypothetical protein
MSTDTNPTREAVNAIGTTLIALLRKSKNDKTADFLETKINAMNDSKVESEEDDLFAAVIGLPEVPSTPPKVIVNPHAIDEGGIGAFAARRFPMASCPHTVPRDEGSAYKCPWCGEIAEGVETDAQGTPVKWGY